MPFVSPRRSLRAIFPIGLVFGLVFVGIATQAFAQGDPPIDAAWIWTPDAPQDGTSPAGDVWFRREVVATEPSTGEARIACSYPFVLWVNGQKVGEGKAWAGSRFNLNGLVDRGRIVIGVQVKIEAPAANQGLLVDGEIRGQSGKSISFDSTEGWSATRKAPIGSDWLKPGYDASEWGSAQPLKETDKAPWSEVAFPMGELDRFQLPPGFEIERIAEPELVGSLVAMTWGQQGRLLVSREFGPVFSVSDENGDGKFDKVVEFSPEIKNCQGLCQVRDEVYLVGDGPQGAGIYRLPDHNSDGVADGIEHLVTHKGSMGEHGPHDVVWGPDGWLYHNLGNHAWVKEEPQSHSSVSKPYEGDLLQPRFEDGNGHAAGIPVPGGSIWRFTPDGKRWWLETAGFRNQYDVAFNSAAELFTFDSDMEWDVGQPWYRPVRVNHCVPGAEFGWRSGTANWPAYYFDSLPATVDVGRGSPTGVVFYEHERFPAEYQGSLLCCDWSLGRILAIRLRPDGVSYLGEVLPLVSGNPLNVSDIEVDRDGSVIFSTGGRRTEGGLYRVRYRGEEPTAPVVASDFQGLLDLPQWTSAWAREDAEKVRRAMGAKEWKSSLEKAARPNSETAPPGKAEARQIRALTMMCQLGPAPSIDLLMEVAQSPDAGARAFAALLLGDHPSAETAKTLTKLLADPEPLVQRRACEGFVRVGLKPPKAELLTLLDHADRWLRFAARLALERRSDLTTKDLDFRRHPRRSLEVALAMVHQKSKSAGEPVLRGVLDLLTDSAADDRSRLDSLRLVELALISGQKSPSLEKIAGRLVADFPSEDLPFDQESARVLAAMHIPEATDKLLDAMEAAPTQDQSLHYALCLAYIKEGWRPEGSDRLMAWYEKTAAWEGGHSLALNVENIVTVSLEALTPEARSKAIANWRTRPLSTRLLLKRSQPDQVADYPGTIARLLDDIDAAEAPSHGEELVAFTIEALGKSDSTDSQALLRRLFDEHADRREILIRALASKPSGENVPYYLRSLPSLEGPSLQICLKALKDSGQRQDKPAPLRSVIMAGLKLGAEGGLAAAELLREWTGVEHNAGLDEAKALAHYQRWFAEKFPEEPPVEAPLADASKTRYTFAELVALLEEQPKGDLARGEKAFAKANCLKCHRFAGKGEGVGPDLSAVRRRFQRKEIVESLVYPSLVISDQYRAVTVATKAGQQFTGMPVSKPGAAKLTLLLADATRIEIAPAEIEEQSPAKISIMPEGVLKDLSKEEIVDLFTYLETSKGAAIEASAKTSPDKAPTAKIVPQK